LRVIKVVVEDNVGRAGGGRVGPGQRHLEEGSYLRLKDFLYHSTLGLRVIKTKQKVIVQDDVGREGGGRVGPGQRHLKGAAVPRRAGI